MPHRPCLQATFSIIIIIRIIMKCLGDNKWLSKACSSQLQRTGALGNNHRRVALDRSNPVQQPCSSCTICSINTTTTIRTMRQLQVPVQPANIQKVPRATITTIITPVILSLRAVNTANKCHIITNIKTIAQKRRHLRRHFMTSLTQMRITSYCPKPKIRS